jgi:hypothetical protein
VLNINPENLFIPDELFFKISFFLDEKNIELGCVCHSYYKNCKNVLSGPLIFR